MAESVHDEPVRPCPHVIGPFRLSGDTSALREAEETVRTSLCPHARPVMGAVGLLAEELVWQVLQRRRGRPIRLTLTCREEGVEVAVEVSGLRAKVFEEGRSSQRMQVVQRIAESWGVLQVRSGVRVWAVVRHDRSAAREEVRS